jgi:hypothetical protein
MTIKMNDSHINNINQVEEFIKVAGQNKNNKNQGIEFECRSRQERYLWIDQTLGRFHYFSLRKKDKGIIRNFIKTLTGISTSQLTKLIAKKKHFGKLFFNQSGRHKFAATYTPVDVALLVATDNAHSRLSGKATKHIFEREYQIFNKKEYIRLRNISVSHIYNLRGKRQYLSNTLFWQKTKPTPVNIGQRAKPESFGKPGFVRVDTAHQGDRDKEKGVYHINFVDEATQWELVACVEKISESYLTPILEKILQQFPFRVINFHSDNGSEYINKVVAELLNKLLIRKTKSRARHYNDNALVEGKNGSIVRKHLGRNFISRKHAQPINKFYEDCFNVYLNFHRPCGFATVIRDARGKEKKVYNVYQTPYEALKRLPNAKSFLKEGISFEILDKIAYGKSDNEYAALMQKAKVELFKTINHKSQLPTTFSTSNFMLIS